MAHRKTPVPLVPSNSLVASAVRYTGGTTRGYASGSSQGWQSECYRHFRICGEARFAAKFYGHALSRAVLGIARRSPDGIEHQTTGPAVDLLHTLFNGKDGQKQMLEAIGLHFAIAGECYLVGRTLKGRDVEETGEVWEIVSIEEIKVTGKKWSIQYEEDTPSILLDDDDVVIRLWMPDPARRMQPDSPFRSLLPILSEIEWLTRSIFAQNSSRLAGAGLLLLPQGISFPPPPDVDGVPQEYANEADGFMQTLASAMIESLDDPSNPANKVPVTALLPPDAIDKVRLMHFWSDLDAQSGELRGEAIRRFALGMDIPPEQVLGMSSNGGTGGGTSNGVSHWGAWQIEEQTIKLHIEPMLDLVVNALTVSYLRPLVTTGEEVVYDTAALRLRPDRSQESMELYDRGLVTGEVVVRENGFDILADMPDDKALSLWLLKKIAGGSATPEQVGAALKALGVDLGIEEEQAIDVEDTRESRPPPSLEEHPERPRTPEPSALLAACDGLVYRALEKAGNRALNAGVRGKNRDKKVEPTEFHCHQTVWQGADLLKDAFNYAPRVLAGMDDHEQVIETLSDYCLALFATQTPHTRQTLAEYLSRRGIIEAMTSQPFNVNVNVEAAPAPQVNMPENFVHVDVSPTPVTMNVNPTPVTVENAINPEINVTNPEVKVSVEPTPFNLSVEPTPVEVAVAAADVQVHVEPTPFTVESPTVNVEAPSVTVEPPVVNVAAPSVSVENTVPPAQVVVEPVRRPRETRVLRDESGEITGVEEVE